MDRSGYPYLYNAKALLDVGDGPVLVPVVGVVVELGVCELHVPRLVEGRVVFSRLVETEAREVWRGEDTVSYLRGSAYPVYRIEEEG